MDANGSAGSPGSGGAAAGNFGTGGEDGSSGITPNPPESFVLGSGSITNGFFDSSQDSGNGTGLTTSELQNESNLTGFDFSVDWQIDPNVNSGFPNLRGVTPGGGSPPAPTPDFDTDTAIPLAGDTVDFVDLSQAPNSFIQQYSWSFGDGSTSSLDEPSNQFSTGGLFSVNLQVTNSDGSSNTVQKDVLIVEESGQGVVVTGGGIVQG